MTTLAQAQAQFDTFLADLQKFHAILHGDANTTVILDSGIVSSLRKASADLLNELIAQGGTALSEYALLVRGFSKVSTPIAAGENFALDLASNPYLTHVTLTSPECEMRFDNPLLPDGYTRSFIVAYRQGPTPGVITQHPAEVTWALNNVPPVFQITADAVDYVHYLGMGGDKYLGIYLGNSGV